MYSIIDMLAATKTNGDAIRWSGWDEKCGKKERETEGTAMNILYVLACPGVLVGNLRNVIGYKRDYGRHFRHGHEEQCLA